MIKQVIIKPLYGIEGLRFGLSRAEVLDMLGKADELSQQKYQQRDGDCVDEVWQYRQLGLDLTFASVDDWRLGTIAVSSDQAQLAGLCLIGLDEKTFLERIRQTEISPLELEDDFVELGSRNYVCDRLNLAFWIQDGRLDTISLLPDYDNNDVISWPA